MKELPEWFIVAVIKKMDATLSALAAGYEDPKCTDAKLMAIVTLGVLYRMKTMGLHDATMAGLEETISLVLEDAKAANPFAGVTQAPAQEKN